jgi:hypothetical protein
MIFMIVERPFLRKTVRKGRSASERQTAQRDFGRCLQ